MRTTTAGVILAGLFTATSAVTTTAQAQSAPDVAAANTTAGTPAPNPNVIKLQGAAAQGLDIDPSKVPVTFDRTEIAQTPPTGAAATAPVGPPAEVIVTGTRIRDADALSAAPITVLDAKQFEATSATTLEQVFQKVPALDFSQGETSNSNNGGSGESQISLRNLGPQRTLVLLNGHRFAFTDNQGNQSYDAVDINNIPVSMIDTVQILRDGASSIYGADAIAGVVNIITKKLDGVEVGGQFGESSYGDGMTHAEYSTLGHTFDKGNFTVNVSEDSRDPILASARDWATTQHPEADFNNYNNLSSRVTGAAGLVNGTKYYWGNGLGSGVLASQAYLLGTTNLPTPSYLPPGSITSGGGLTPGDIGIAGAGVYFNTLPNAGLTSGLKRKQANFTSDIDITEDVHMSVSAFYTNRQSQEQLNPEPTGYNTPTPLFPNGLSTPAFLADGTVNPYSPLNASVVPNAQSLYGAAIVNGVCSLGGANGIAGHNNSLCDIPILTRRFENGPRLYSDEVNTYFLNAELSGTIFTSYDWQVGQVYSRSSGTFRTANETNFYHLSQELGMNPCPANGAAIGCSVANFYGYNTLTSAQANYLDYDNTDTSATNTETTYANISGPIYQLPAGAVSLAAGFEFRTDSMFDHPDSVTAQGDGAIYSTPTSGSYQTTSGYGELKVPVLADMPFVKKLDLDLQSRYDFNTTFGRSLTYKAQINYTINDDFRLRGSHSTAFRAPQVKELYAGASYGEVGGSDPCAPGGSFVGSSACVAALAAAGVSSTNQVNQITVASGGNAELKPENAQEWNIGAAFTPQEIKNFSATVDFYSIFIRNEINTYSAISLLDDCYGGVAYLVTQSQACSLVGPRLKGTGVLGVIPTINENIGAENTDGIEIAVNWMSAMEDIGLPAWGNVSVNGQTEYLLSDNLLNGGTIIQQAGHYGLNGGDDAEPRWKALLALTYSNPTWSATWTSRYYGGVNNIDNTSVCEYGSLSQCNPNAPGAKDFEGNEAAGVFYHDISATYHYHNVQVTVGVDNLFDKDPPFLYPTGQGNNAAASSGYDEIGRFVYLKLKATL